MESTNSGSIQSSSSGDNEEYDAVIDSPAPSSSSTFFLNLPPPPPPPPPPATTHPASSSIFDSFSPYFAPFPFPPEQHAATWPSPPPPPPPPPLLSATAPSSARGGPTPPPVQPVAAPRGPKKRTRASRRAPTTVINTETSNFRSMVQQFTGFPSPPFGAAAAAPQFQSPGLQLDLFGSSAAAVPQFLLRPSAQKMIPSPASSSASPSPSLFDHFIARSNLASIGNSSITSADVDGAPKFHDRFPLSLFEQQPDADAANRGTERGSFMQPSFRQPQRAQVAQLRAEFAGGSLGSLIATGGAATNITNNNRPRTDAGLRWDVNEQSGEERRPASSIEDQQPYQKLWRPNLD